MKEFITMSRKEAYRLDVIKHVENKQLSQIKAAELLDLSDRQIRNLLHSLKKEGVEGVISKKRGKMRNRQLNPSIKQRSLMLVREHYTDFSPTFAQEKLQACHQINISRETLRLWMIEERLWIPKVKKKKLHLPRCRKEHFGEMLQGDGSHHDWFENGSPCALLYFIDDATSRITAARFATGETLDGYFQVLEEHLNKWGVPISIYTDRFSVFESSVHKENLTQFRISLQSLEVKWIGANSPQAKGRIERCNRTLQNRLVKEMRLRGIKTIEEGNCFLEEFVKEHNNKFSKKPMKDLDLHRPLERGVDLSRTLSRYEERTLTKDLTFQFHNKHYKIMQPPIGYSRGKRVEVRQSKDGMIRVFDGNVELIVKNVYDVEEKLEQAMLIWTSKKKQRVKHTHPWKQRIYRKSLITNQTNTYSVV